MSDTLPQSLTDLRQYVSYAVSDLSAAARSVVFRSRGHYERVEPTPARVTVTGVRGKSTVVRWLNETLVDRGFETYAKVTGDQPVSYHNCDGTRIERDGTTRLYENAAEFAEYHPVDAAIVENQGIREYTTRLANELFDPQVVILLNVRRDHQSTLGDDLDDIARVFTRVIPENTAVISGDRNDAINTYLRQEFQKTGHEFRVAEPDGEESPFADVFGARSALLVSETLRELGLDPLEPSQIQTYIDSLHREWGWQRLEKGGLIANGAMMNDIESTELLRQFLVERLENNIITPFIYTRRDRAGRTAAFVQYLNWLHANNLITQIHAAGTQDTLLQRRVNAGVVRHRESEHVADVLDSALTEGHPVYMMGNTVAEFMRDLTEEVDQRTLE
ncbi:folylpolyglutamate synthase/dihydrofolate synthase family protein [Halobellus salinus]|uniref:Mur ligase family protein n=1 Tax=Halobellus salinus TaxID=931585 RepID=UPI001E34B1A3|nr:Mur ligase family protein [Halobellus salinus]